MEAEPRGKGVGSEHKKADEGGAWVKLRMRINELEKDKLLLTSNHNQEVCALRAELAALRACAERLEAQRAELCYQLTVAAAEKHSLSERADKDQHALQQEVKERERVVQRLRRRLKEQQEELQENQRREREEERMRKEREERKSREEEELMKTLQSTLEAERTAHLQCQVRGRSLEAALQEAELCGQRLRSGSTEREEELRVERERRSLTEHALQRLQSQLLCCQSELSVAMETERKTTSDLTEQLEEERRRHAHTLTQLQQMIPDAAAKPHGKQSPDVLQRLRSILSSAHFRQEAAQQQILKLQQQNSEHDRQRHEAELRLKEEAAKLRQATAEKQRLEDERERESEQWASERARERAEWASERERERTEWVTKMERERAQWATERERYEKEKERERAEWASERTAMEAESQRVTEESTVHLSFLYSLYQHLLSGCVTHRHYIRRRHIDCGTRLEEAVVHEHPHCIMGNFTWEELCDVITEQVDQLTSDLSTAKEKVSRLLRVCEQRSVCVERLEHSHKCVVSQLKLSRSQCDSLTSDLSESRGEAASFLAACALLAGALRHAHRRLLRLCHMKTLLWWRLQEGVELEQEVRRLADALGGGLPEPGRAVARTRWRRSLWAVLAVTRWQLLVKNNHVVFWFDGVGGAMGVCGFRQEAEPDTGDLQLGSAHLRSTVLSSMCDLQGTLNQTGSAHIIPAGRSALSRLLDHVLDQSELSALSRRVTSQINIKAVASVLQQHFLLFSQRLHSSEVERRSLRLELSNQSRGAEKEKRSLRIVGKHLVELQWNRKQLKKKLKEAHRRSDHIIRWMKAAEMSCNLVTESLSQSQHPLRAVPLLMLSRTESMLGAPELEACQRFLSAVSQLCHVSCSRIGRLEQEVPKFTETFPLINVKTTTVSPCDQSKLRPFQINPTPSVT
ncbi:coiled-coil domain-containing protein 171 isoform X2 [Gouania willdenowi]|uniref:coiled-coil domain-containing protein 171 isoform X2 n=1 Tax=Gouania willdenowi TaxID=441366 RepID=UPI00105640F0|nr:coiled-coil domain-containing protein 171-like isoform X2 [Gouania willdenowi]